MCGNGREGIKKFFGDYIGNRPWFMSNVLKEPKFQEPQTKVRRFDEDYADNDSKSESNNSSNNNDSNNNNNGDKIERKKEKKKVMSQKKMKK